MLPAAGEISEISTSPAFGDMIPECEAEVMSDSVPAHDVRLLRGGDGVVSRCSSTGTGTGEIERARVGETYGGGEEGRVRWA